MKASRSSMTNDRGFTLVEVTIILLVLVILSSIMLPQLGNFNRLARRVKVGEDVGALCASIKKWLDEVMLGGPYVRPGGGVESPSDPIGLLVGPGNTPAISAAIFGLAPRTSSDIWDETVITKNAFTVETDGLSHGIVEFDTDLLFNHLQVNNPQGLSVGFRERYKNVIELPSVGSWFGWRGPYFNELTADPWGTRYSVNTFGLHSGSSGAVDDIFTTAVVCISFGPDKAASTLANQPIDLEPYGFIGGGDDVVAVLSGVGPF